MNIAPYFNLLLLADPSPSLVKDYAHAGHVFGASIEGEPIGVYVLLHLGDHCWELKNIAVDGAQQGNGIGQTLLSHAIETAKELGCISLEVGTASSGERQIRFYERAGFTADHVDKGFFIRNYAEPVIDGGVQCIDMLYFKQDL